MQLHLKSCLAGGGLAFHSEKEQSRAAGLMLPSALALVWVTLVRSLRLYLMHTGRSTLIMDSFSQ